MDIPILLREESYNTVTTIRLTTQASTGLTVMTRITRTVMMIVTTDLTTGLRTTERRHARSVRRWECYMDDEGEVSRR